MKSSSGQIDNMSVTWIRQFKEKKYPWQPTYRIPMTQELRMAKAYLIDRAREIWGGDKNELDNLATLKRTPEDCRRPRGTRKGKGIYKRGCLRTMKDFSWFSPPQHKDQKRLLHVVIDFAVHPHRQWPSSNPFDPSSIPVCTRPSHPLQWESS
jgi:hypothetical protein